MKSYEILKKLHKPEPVVRRRNSDTKRAGTQVVCLNCGAEHTLETLSQAQARLLAIGTCHLCSH